MNLYTSISRRKSCRKYDMQPLGRRQLDEIDAAIKGFEPLLPGRSPGWRFTGQVKGRFHVAAPHYLIVSGQGQQGKKENIGYLFEQLVLWFDAMELGCVWLGSSKDAEAASAKDDVITIAFGRAAEPLHRTAMDEFQRKPIEKITNAPEDPCIKAVHLAPSGMNTQPWYLDKQEGRVLLYQQKLKPPLSLLYKHSDIDMGIGLCHYALACKEVGRPFGFSASTALPARAGYLPFGVIE